MTHQIEDTLKSHLVEKEFEAVPELLCVLINYAIQAEWSKYLQADGYDRF